MTLSGLKESHRFGWMPAVVGHALPGEELDDPVRAWRAGAEALGGDASALTQKVAEAFSLPVVDLSERDIQASSDLDESLTRRFLAIPVKMKARWAKVATCDPGNLDTLRQLEFLLGRTVELCVAPPLDLLPLLDALPMEGMETSAEWAHVSEEVETGEGQDRSAVLSAGFPGALDKLVVRGVQIGASDIHVQTTGNAATVRFRVDGVLHMGPQLPADEMASVLGRAKAVGGMDPSVRLRPQDGRARIKVGDAAYDLRLSTIPASHSESLVIRILAQRGTLSLDTFDADPDAVQRLGRGFLDQTAGIFTVTGPTGSGKTTLLYSLLDRLNTPERHIHTVEDPVEVELQGLAQVQVNPKAGLTFSGALRSILRQDPDVVLVGETRDPETAKVVTQAALTGHLVATTLHTIDSATALLRFSDLDVEPAELSEALNGVSAQRLLRKLCPDCREPVADAGSHIEEWFAEISGGLPAFRAVGCDRCRHSGYLGRFPAVEVLLVDSELRKALLRGARVEELRTIAQAGGMRTMARVAVDRAFAGDTDVEEIRRVMGSDLLSSDHLGTSGVSRPGGSTLVAGSPTGSPASSVGMGGGQDDDTLYGEHADALLITHNHRHQVIVTDGLTKVGLEVRVETDLPAGAVWAEIHRPRLLVLDLVEDGEKSVTNLSAAYDAFHPLALPISVLVLAPPDDKALEKVLLEHGFTDYLRAPVVSDWVGFMADQSLRRVEVLGRPLGV